MLPTRALTEGVHVLPSFVPFPGYGGVPVNAFLLEGREPILVDTGVAADREAFLDALERVIDPAELAWIWMTHADPDHVGALWEVLRRAPRARLVTNFLGAGKLNLIAPIPLERFHFLNPGQMLNTGDRRLRAMRPPIFDAPETLAAFDEEAKILLSSDFFGALLDAPADDASELTHDVLTRAQRLWASIDAPWLEIIDASRLRALLERVQALAPRLVLSSHLPPASGLLERMLENLDGAIGAAPFVGPSYEDLPPPPPQAHP